MDKNEVLKQVDDSQQTQGRPSPWDKPHIKMVELRLVAEPQPQFLYQVKVPQDVARLLHNLIGNADREHFVAVYLNVTHSATHVHIVSVGTLNTTLVHPREVFKGALLANAKALVVGHNHPSGNVLPSDDDRRVHEQLTQAGALLGINLLDSVIVGPGQTFYSFLDMVEGSLAA